MLALVAAAPGFNDTAGPLRPLLSTPPGAGCSATVADVTLTSLGTGNDAALLLDHQAGPASGFWDVVSGACVCCCKAFVLMTSLSRPSALQHIRLYYRVGLKARFGPPAGEAHGSLGSGGGLVSNSWFWAADHNLSDMLSMDCSATNCTSHRPVGQSYGEQVSRRVASWATNHGLPVGAVLWSTSSSEASAM